MAETTVNGGDPLTDPATRLRFAKMEVCGPFIAALRPR